MGTVRFLFIAGCVAVTTSILSIIWPSVTGRPRPEAVAVVYSVVRKTAFGRKATAVLGVSDTAVKQLDFQGIAQDAVHSVVGTIERRAQTVIITQAMRTLLGQYQSLTDEQKQLVRTFICEPQPEASPAGRKK